MGERAVVITCSDAAARGSREDRSGPAVAELAASIGFAPESIVVVPDEVDAIAAAIAAAAARARLVLTTGGTGIAPRDVTPEATLRACDRIIPGFGELMRATSPMGALSRAQAASLGTALVVNLPGSPRGATECLRAISHLIPHALELLSGAPVEKHP